MFLLKQALREKVASRIHVHNSFADLHKHVPKEILPKDYDGDDQSIEQLSGKLPVIISNINIEMLVM